MTFCCYQIPPLEKIPPLMAEDVEDQGPTAPLCVKQLQSVHPLILYPETMHCIGQGASSRVFSIQGAEWKQSLDIQGFAIKFFTSKDICQQEYLDLCALHACLHDASGIEPMPKSILFWHGQWGLVKTRYPHTLRSIPRTLCRIDLFKPLAQGLITLETLRSKYLDLKEENVLVDPTTREAMWIDFTYGSPLRPPVKSGPQEAIPGGSLGSCTPEFLTAQDVLHISEQYQVYRQGGGVESLAKAYACARTYTFTAMLCCKLFQVVLPQKSGLEAFVDVLDAYQIPVFVSPGEKNRWRQTSFDVFSSTFLNEVSKHKLSFLATSFVKHTYRCFVKPDLFFLDAEELYQKVQSIGFAHRQISSELSSLLIQALDPDPLKRPKIAQIYHKL